MSEQAKKQLSKIVEAQAKHKAYWLSLCTSFVVNIALATFAVWIYGNRWHRPAPIFFGIVGVISISTADYLFRQSSAQLQHFAKWASRKIIMGKAFNQLDWLRLPAYLCIVAVYIPLSSAIFLAVFRRHGWLGPTCPEYAKFSDALKQMATLAAGLLAAQIAIFNFLFGQILGRFSSSLAIAISQHRTIRLLRNYSLLLIGVLYACFFFGAPDNFRITGWLIVVSLISAFGLTIWVSHLGIQIDQAVLYAGEHGARRIRASASAPVLQSNLWWRFLAYFGLDWRSPERIGGVFVPEQMAAQAQLSLNGLFNAAHKSIQENQQETLIASLRAIARVVMEYTEQRGKYSGQSDAGIGFINDQFAGLLTAAQANKNEYLISHVITYIGFCGKAVIRLGYKPDEGVRVRQRSSRYFGNWSGVLREAYLLGHNLKRSTAASEAINQLGELGMAAVVLKYYDDVQYSFLREMKEIYVEALKVGSFYHLGLCGLVMRNLLKVWAVSFTDEGMFYVSKPMAALIKESALMFSHARNLASIDLSDPVTALTTKTGEMPTLQDIAGLHCSALPVEFGRFVTLHKSFSEVRDAICGLVEDALARDILFAGSYADAYYEIVLQVAFISPQHVLVKGNNEVPDVREVWLLSLISKLAVMINAASQSKNARSELLGELAGALGLTLIVAKDSSSPKLIAACKAIIEQLASQTITHTAERAKLNRPLLEYVQLFGAWCLFLGEDDMATKMATKISAERAERSPYSSFSRGLWSSRGYPESGDITSGDYALPYPRNLNQTITASGFRTLEAWNERLMDQGRLETFWNMIEAITNGDRVRNQDSGTAE